ncbi:hypothetical protein AB1Y20_023053 [Prymnesium parvum]|uniref:MICOS complex subunit n=1 Tax=Prymnesium parvum TaxID=97485 RepID=A0AB34JF20_PRYPA|mmetsp:Transcript_30137/g.75310  ORF Transcript_30137/g.75310 Transcript_30137/m.75310 type:complete len:174 (-) Transcript_30137:282-803(-)
MAEGKDKPSIFQQAQELVNRPNANEVLAEKLAKDWAWVQSLFTRSSDNSLRQKIASVRQEVEVRLNSLQEVAAKTEDTVTWLQTPSETTQGIKAKALELRRKFPGLIVGAITAAAMVPPALRKAPFYVARNFVIAGGVSSALLYPELFFLLAPKVSRTASKMEEQVKEKMIGK